MRKDLFRPHFIILTCQEAPELTYNLHACLAKSSSWMVQRKEPFAQFTCLRHRPLKSCANSPPPLSVSIGHIQLVSFRFIFTPTVFSHHLIGFYSWCRDTLPHYLVRCSQQWEDRCHRHFSEFDISSLFNKMYFNTHYCGRSSDVSATVCKIRSQLSTPYPT